MILRVLDYVAAHVVGLPLDATLIVVDLRNRQLHDSLLRLLRLLLLRLLLLRLLLLLLLLLLVTQGHLLLVLLLLLLLLLQLLSLQSIHRVQGGGRCTFLRPRGPLVSVVTEFSWLLIVLLVDNVLEGEAQGTRVPVKPQGVLQPLLLESQCFP